jgi:autotransporter-associated beta strand protein
VTNAIGTTSAVTVTGTLAINNTSTVGSLAGAGNITLGAALTSGTNNTTTTFSGIISGTSGLTQNDTGTGILVLSGANTYSGGGTTITAGTLQIGAAGTSGSITGNVTDGGTLAFDRSNALTFSGIVSGTGGLTQEGSNTLTLTGASTYTGATNVSSGTPGDRRDQCHRNDQRRHGDRYPGHQQHQHRRLTRRRGVISRWAPRSPPGPIIPRRHFQGSFPAPAASPRTTPAPASSS